jgi:hypothetical protein
MSRWRFLGGSKTTWNPYHVNAGAAFSGPGVSESVQAVQDVHDHSIY